MAQSSNLARIPKETYHDTSEISFVGDLFFYELEERSKDITIFCSAEIAARGVAQ